MQFRIAAAAALAFSVLAAAPAAQEQAVGESASEGEPAGGAGPDLARLLGDVNAIADRLAENIGEAETALAAASDSREDGVKLFDRMRASVEAVHAGFAEDGDIWTELGRALAVWDENRKAALENSGSDPAFDEVADGWAERIAEAAALRERILTQRAESMALLNRILSEEELILAWYELGQADKALEAMRRVGDEMVRMNESMRAIVDRMTAVAGPAIPQ